MSEPETITKRAVAEAFSPLRDLILSTAGYIWAKGDHGGAFELRDALKKFDAAIAPAADGAGDE